MSLFKCSKCGNIENTATSGYWFRGDSLPLCTECDPNFKSREKNRQKYNPIFWRMVDNRYVEMRWFCWAVIKFHLIILTRKIWQKIKKFVRPMTKSTKKKK